jgi:hypothetical protein
MPREPAADLILVAVETLVERRAVGGELLECGDCHVGYALEQQIVVWPELALLTGAPRRLVGEGGVGVSGGRRSEDPAR